MTALTICLAGLQLTWTVELAYGSPYLISLGLSKAVLSLVWLAGPLSGLIMQPIVGSMSDRCTSSLGRRRPFMIAGTISVVFCFFLIGWTREIVQIFIKDPKESVIALAIAAFYLLDFAINAIQASIRALIVDILPTEQQDDGNAWAGRMIGVGSVAGYLFGFVDLVKVFPWVGETQIKVFCAIAIVILVLTVAASCFVVTEVPLDPVELQHSNGGSSSGGGSLNPLATLKSIWRAMRTMPAGIRSVCNTQFFAWIGWFPFLFYATTWVSELYQSSAEFQALPVDSDRMGAATRQGSRAFFIYSLTSLAAAVLLPLLISVTSKGFKIGSLRLRLTVTHCYTISHLIFAVAMLSTFWVNSVAGASALIITCGISWAIMMWAPFALIGELIARQQQGAVSQPPPPKLQRKEEGPNSASPTPSPPLSPKGNDSPPVSPVKMEQGQGSSDGEPLEAGAILGIHNVYVVLPQFLITFVASIVFALLEGPAPEHKETADGEEAHSADAIGWVLRIGGASALVAAYFSTRIARHF
ncbi:MAG: sugar transporter [Piptocephalis tieghemiana]|nr:MAG: sugar transporter [Piptocephalis tieghemiana]